MRYQIALLLLLFGGVSTLAQVVITPSAPPAVNQGTTFTFTANVPVTWSCPSCAGSIDSSTGVYTAPATIHSNQSSGGYQLLPNDHIYNTRIDSVPVNSNSATWIAAAGSASFNYYNEFPVNYTDGSTPTETALCFINTSMNGVYQVPALPFVRVESGYYTDRNVADKHQIQVDTTTGLVEEFYNQSPTTATTLTSCAKYQNSTYDLPNSEGSTDAAGLYLQPLILRAQEFEQAVAAGGTIKHALRFTLQNSYIAPGGGGEGVSYLWPATTSSFAGGGLMPDGARIRLKSSFNISTFTPAAQVLLTQLKQYGMILCDGGTGWTITTEYTRWPEYLQHAFVEVAGIAQSNFEVVDESGLKVSNNSGLTTTSETVVATDISNPAHTARQQVVLTGVTLTLAKDSINIQTGAPAQQLTAFINGSANKGITWSMSPSIGTLTSSGLYTPPTTNKIFTVETQAGNVFTRAVEDLNVSTTGTYNATAQSLFRNPGGEWIQYMVALKSAGTPYGVHPVQAVPQNDSPTICTNCNSGFGVNTTSGNLGVIAIYEDTDATATISSATFDCGTMVEDANSPKRGASSSMWVYTTQITGVCAGGTIHIRFNHSVREFMSATEYHHIATSNVVDCSSAGTGSGRFMDSGSCATGTAADTLFAYTATKAVNDQILAGGASTVITATSAADPTVATQMTVNIFPSGAIRLILGWPTDYVDTDGNTWQSQIGDDGCFPDSVGLTGWPTVPDISLYQIPCFGNNDMRFDFYVPSGNYSITGKFTEYVNLGIGKRLMNLESQGKVVYSNVDIQSASGGVKKPLDYTVPATVSNGLLSFVVRHITYDNADISALEIDPISSSGPPPPSPPLDLRVIVVK